jgi:hypothetical protein
MQANEPAHDGTPNAALSLAQAKRLSDVGELGDRCGSCLREGVARRPWMDGGTGVPDEDLRVV